MKKKAVGVIIWLLIFYTEIFKRGAILCFDNPENQVPIRVKLCHFDPCLLTNGNWWPFITAVLSALAVILLLIYFKTNSKKVLRGIKNICCIAIIMSLMPIIMGLIYLTKIGFAVSFLLLMAVCWCNYMLDWT